MRRVHIAASIVLLAGVIASPAAAQSPPASPGPSPASSAVALCADVPDVDLSAAPFRDSPIYIGNDQPTEELRGWASQQPGFEELWIDRDHLGWVVLAFSEDAAARQADLEREFPDVGAVAVGVDWTRAELEALERTAVSGSGGLVLGSSTDIIKGVVELFIGPLEPERVAEVERRFAGKRVCIDGVDPSTLPSPGPQPQAGDGWRLLGHRKVGAPYRTGIAADRPSFKALWRRIGMPGRAPVVDFEREVAVWFGAVYGSSCPRLRMDDVVVDADAAIIHPTLVTLDALGGCTDDANGHAFVVALERDRLPAPPFRIQLSADDPPLGATKEITVVDADLRVPGSVPGPGEVRTQRPPQNQRYLRSGDIMETAFPDDFLLDTRCGVEWLGRLNHIWWRTEVPSGVTAWVPEAWRSSVRPDGSLPVRVLLREASDPAVTDGQPRAEVTANDETLIYHASMEAAPSCP